MVTVTGTRHIISGRNLFRSAGATFLASAFTLSNSALINYAPVPDPHPSHENIAERTTPVELSRTSGEESALPPAGAAASSPLMELGIDGSSIAPEIAGADEVKRYLWHVYQRSGTKLDSHGDFTWKDAAAAVRFGLSVHEYVIGGIDPDFREQLFAAGQAMDAAGIDWTILSGFRDDFRQSVAVGLKAHAGNSFHGGSIATGGYAHGCAVDLASTDGGVSNYAVWNWLDQNGAQFGMYRPLRGIDPAHIQPSAGWHAVAAALRDQRLGARSELEAADATQNGPDELLIASSTVSPSAGLTEEQYNCVRPRPPQEADRPARIVGHLKMLVASLLASPEVNHWKAKWKATNGTTNHRVIGHRPASEIVSHHAKVKQGTRLAG